MENFWLFGLFGRLCYLNASWQAFDSIWIVGECQESCFLQNWCCMFFRWGGCGIFLFLFEILLLCFCIQWCFLLFFGLGRLVLFWGFLQQIFNKILRIFLGQICSLFLCLDWLLNPRTLELTIPITPHFICFMWYIMLCIKPTLFCVFTRKTQFFLYGQTICNISFQVHFAPFW